MGAKRVYIFPRLAPDLPQTFPLPLMPGKSKVNTVIIRSWFAGSTAVTCGFGG